MSKVEGIYKEKNSDVIRRQKDNTESKLQILCEGFTCFCQTKYTLSNITKYKRALFTKFRFSSHNSHKIPRNERFCPFCPGSVESEAHFLLSCDKYANIRESYINKHVNLMRIKNPSQDDLTTIINLLTQTIYLWQGTYQIIWRNLLILERTTFDSYS